MEILNHHWPTLGLRHRRCSGLLLACLLTWGNVSALEPGPLLAANPMAAASTTPSEAPEYNIKAGYLRLFVRYVEWPPAVFAQATDPLVIGVVGTNPFGPVLQSTLQGLKKQNREIVVRPVQTVEEAVCCQVVFIARRQEHDEAIWLKALRGKPALTITESEQGLAWGAVLALVYEKTARGPKVVFYASLPAARAAGLQLSSSMLVSAKKVLKERNEIKGGS